MNRRTVKSNPAFLSDQELIRSFVVRLADLQLIVRTIGENVTNANQHILVIGPRGSGKTTLVRRVALEVENGEALSRLWYPLIFSEESYEVVTIGEFWLEALFHLAEQTSDDRWRRTYEELKKNEPDDRRLAERALAQLLDFADGQGKRILLIVENLNMLFSDLLVPDDAWKMRHTLMNEPRLMLLATATSRFETIENTSQALFEMFRIHELKPLGDDECHAVWEMVAGERLSGDQIRAIRILTGGNPRLLVIIAKFSGHRSFGKLLDDLVDLIDDHTEYFKSQLDHLPAIERKVYLALADLWDPSTARDIARSARLDVNKTSSLLNRLVGRGAVLVEEQRKKTKWYMVAERMYNIYYLMRRRGRPSDRVKAMVRFMVCIYGPESATRLIAEEADHLAPELCGDHYLAYSEVMKALPDRQMVERIIASTPKHFLEAPYVSETLKDCLMSAGKKASKASPGAKKKDREKELFAAMKELAQLVDDGKSIDVVEKCDHLMNKLGYSDQASGLDSMAAAAVLMIKGVALSELNRMEEAVLVYDEMIASYKDRPEPRIVEQVAKAMFNKGITLGGLNRSEEELQVYDGMIASYKDRPEPQIVELVASAMFNKGVALGGLNRSEEELQVYDEMIASYKDRPEPRIVEQVAKAVFNKGVTLGGLNRSEEELQVYDEIIGLYKDRPELRIVEQVAKAMFNKGVTLGGLNRSEEELQVYDEIIGLYKDRPEPRIVEQVASAMVNKGVILRGLNRSEETIRVYDDVIAFYKDRPEPRIVEQVASAMFNKGVTLGDLNRSEEELQVYDDVIALYKNHPEPRIVEAVASAMINKGVTLGGLNRSEEELQVYDGMIALYKDRPEPQIVVQVASAMVDRGLALRTLNRSEEAVRAYDDVIALYKNHPEPEIVKTVARAMVNKGTALSTLNRSEESIRVYDEILTLYKDRSEPQIVERVTRAMVNKGMALEKLEKYTDAERAFRQAIERNPDLTEAHIRLAALLLEQTGRVEDARQLLETIVGRRPDDPHLLGALAWAFYSHGTRSLLPQAEIWARQAVSLAPGDPDKQHTLACVLSALGKGGEALPYAEQYVRDTALVGKSIGDAIELFVELAASGYAREALDMVAASPAARHLEPLVVGLRLYVGENVKTAVEIMEVAKDVVRKIDERQRSREEQR